MGHMGATPLQEIQPPVLKLDSSKGALNTGLWVFSCCSCCCYSVLAFFLARTLRPQWTGLSLILILDKYQRADCWKNSDKLSL